MDAVIFKSVFEHSPLPMYVLQDGFCRLVNNKVAEVTGYTAEELKKIPYILLVHAEDREMVEEKARRRLAGETVPDKYAFRMVTKGGAVKHFMGYFTPVEIEGRPATLGQIVDVTAQKMLETELQRDIARSKQSEEVLRSDLLRFKDLIDFLPDPTFAVDPERRVIAWNKAMEELTGVPKEDMMGRGNYAYALPFYGRRRPMMVDIVFSRDRKIENTYDYFERNGNVLYSEGYAPNVYSGRGAYLWSKTAPFFDGSGNLLGVIDTCRDITERKRIRDELARQKAYFQQLFENAPIGIAMLDNQDRVLRVNRGFEAMFGYSARELAGRDVKGLIVPGNLSCESLHILSAALEGGAVRRETIRRRKDGSLVYVALFSYPIEVDGKQTGIYAIYIDVTERRQAENLFRTMADSSPIGIYIVQDGKFRLVNPRFQEQTGFVEGELLGNEALRLVHPDDRETVRTKAVRMLKGESVTPYEFRIIDNLGQARWIMETVTSIHYRGHRAALGSFMEITERKQAEERLKYLSLHDTLTGLYNRTYFEQEMRRVSSGSHNPVGIIVCDLDGLKFCNDTLGHDAGDSLLVAAAGVIKQCFREGDVVARIGGDEFAILLRRCELGVLERICRRVKEAIAHYNERNPELPLSISFGLAYCEHGKPDMNVLFKEADNNMYREKLHRNKSARGTMVQTLMKALEARDFITEGHAERLQDLASGLGKAAGLSTGRLGALRLLARFHDIGKVGIPDRILFKNGPLTAGEMSEMRRHCEIGHRIAKSLPDLEPIADWILKHHEWWNGNGYPLGLAGEKIPLECRILAIVDAYDAMTSNRPYREAMSVDEARAELLNCVGVQFDPRLVQMFMHILDSRPA